MRSRFLPALLAAGLLVAAAPAPRVPDTTAPSVAHLGASLQQQLDQASPTDSLRVFVLGTSTDAARAAVLDAGMSPLVSLDRVDMVTAAGTPAQIAALAASDGVVAVHWADQPAVQYLDTSHQATRATTAHDGAFDVDGDGVGDVLDGSGVSVAIVDSGVDGTHPMFATADGSSRVRKNVKIVCSDAVPLLADVVVDGFATFTPACAVDATAVNDTDTPSAGGHGTHVAGIAGGGAVTDAAGRHLVGAAPNSTLISVSTGASLSVYAGSMGLYWVLEHADDPCGDGTCPPIKAVNNSWGPSGGGSFDATAPDVVIQRALVDAGVNVVWAAGNDGGDGSATATNPYSTDPTLGVISVANYDDADSGTRDGDLNSSSSRGARGVPATYPDISAPGTNITSACRPYLTVCGTGLDTADPNYNTISGTSMAAPHVAGYVALLQQAAMAHLRRFLTPAEVESLIVDTAHPFGPSRTYEPDTRNPDATTGTSFDAGHGLIDVHAALEQLLGVTVDADAGATCPATAEFTDASGDATAVLGTPTPLPSEPGLDVVRAWFTSDPDTADVIFHWQVTDLPDTPGGTSGNGEYFDFNFSYDGAGYYITASRTVTDGESFVLGRFETTRTTLRSGLEGSFDPATDTISAVLPADAIAAAVPGASVITPGASLGGFEIVSRRELVAVVPDADSAKGGCPYVVGAELDNGGGTQNTAPTIEAVTATPNPAETANDVSFAVTASDADGDALSYAWDFGDGTTADGAEATHAFAAAGTYTVTVTVDDGTDAVTDTVTVEVTDPAPQDCSQLSGQQRAQCQKDQRGNGNGNGGKTGGKQTVGKQQALPK